MTTTAVAPARPGTGPQNVTISGRLSFPVWTAQMAYERSQKGSYPAASPAEAKPEFTLLIEQPMLDKMRTHIVDNFFPFCIEQDKEQAKSNRLSAAEVADLTTQIMKPDFAGVYNTPFKPVSEKSAELAPECVAAVKVIGNKGVDIDQRAVVHSEAELLIPDPKLVSFPTVRPLGATVHQLHAGYIVGVTINLYAYHNGKLPGFSAGGSVCVFKAEADRFGGGVAIDEDAMFMD